MRTLLLTFFVSAVLTSWLRAQHLPHQDVLYIQGSNGAQGWTWQTPRFLTVFNPKGYNNQPAFFKANELYLTVQMPEDTTQTDIFALDIAARTRTRVTATTTPEYSPTLMPGGKRFSVVRVEADGTQRLWSFPLDRSDNGRAELPAIEGVGYHCWVNDTLAAVFIVGENDQSHILYSIGTRTQRLQRIASNPGRAMHLTADQKLAFVQKATESTWFLKTWDFKKQSGEIIVKMPSGTEDFAILPDGSYIASAQAKLLTYKPGKDTDWKETLQLGKYGVRKITRIAVGKDGQLAVVVEGP
jgi:hypothetical protein